MTPRGPLSSKRWLRFPYFSMLCPATSWVPRGPALILASASIKLAMAGVSMKDISGSQDAALCILFTIYEKSRAIYSDVTPQKPTWIWPPVNKCINGQLPLEIFQNPFPTSATLICSERAPYVNKNNNHPQPHQITALYNLQYLHRRLVWSSYWLLW